MYISVHSLQCWHFNTLRPRQNGRHFADNTFKRIFLNQIVEILIKISLKFVHKGPINNISSIGTDQATTNGGKITYAYMRHSPSMS